MNARSTYKPEQTTPFLSHSNPLVLLYTALCNFPEPSLSPPMRISFVLPFMNTSLEMRTKILTNI